MQATRVAGGIGRALVALGLLVLAFVAYQLWGTGLSESRSQSRLREELHNQLQQARSHSQHAGTAADAAPAPEGGPEGTILIPRIGLDKVFVEGTGESDLQEGPGHYTGTPLPGQPGNAAIAGHRTTYGAPFYNLNELSAGDAIIITTRQGTFRYDTFRSLIVSPDDSSVLEPTSRPVLTLTTCNPRFSASQRLVVQANLLGAPAPPTPSSVRSPGPESQSLAGGQGDWAPALWWGLAMLAVGAVVVLVARPARRGSVRVLLYTAGTAAVLGLLFLFFESVSPLLPASL